jgi:hypothetical protein
MRTVKQQSAGPVNYPARPPLSVWDSTSEAGNHVLTAGSCCPVSSQGHVACHFEMHDESTVSVQWDCDASNYGTDWLRANKNKDRIWFEA